MINIDISNQITLTGDIPTDVRGKLMNQLTMENPVWVEKNLYGRWVGGTPQYLTFYTETPSGLLIPRGYLKQLRGFLDRESVPYTFTDGTRALPDVQFKFNGTLYESQQNAASKVLAEPFGVAQMPTGAGKTIVALYCIAQRRQPALVVVHTKELLYQWKTQAEQFLGLSGRDIGLIGDGKYRIGRKVTIAIVNSLRKRISTVKDDVGFLIVDECHRVPSSTFRDAVSMFDSRYMLGLSATPKRRDDLTRLIYLYLGDRVFQISPKKLQSTGQIMKASMIIRETGFDFQYTDDYSAMITALTDDDERNNLIADDIIQHTRHSKDPALVVSERKAHCHALADIIRQEGVCVTVLTGDLPRRKRQDIIERVHSDQVDVLLSTTQLIGEGFDCKRLSALFLATPIKTSSRLQQVVGRVLRSDTGKKIPKVYDYVDAHGILKSSFKSRMETYRKIGVIVPN